MQKILTIIGAHPQFIKAAAVSYFVEKEYNIEELKYNAKNINP